MANFLSTDGFLDMDAVNLLNKEITMYVRKYKVEPKTVAVHMVRRTMKPFAKDLSERQLNTRVQMIKERKSFPKLGTKCAIILAVYKDEAFQEDFKKEIAALQKAIVAHNKKAEKALASKKDTNAKLREQNAKKLSKLIAELDGVAKENDMTVETIFSTTGKSYLLEIDGEYLSLGLATPTAIAKIGLEAPKPGAGLAASRAAGKKPAARKPAVKITVRESSRVIDKKSATKSVKQKVKEEVQKAVKKTVEKVNAKAAAKVSKVKAEVEKKVKAKVQQVEKKVKAKVEKEVKAKVEKEVKKAKKPVTIEGTVVKKTVEKAKAVASTKMVKNDVKSKKQKSAAEARA